jgi:hypothetical protein
MRHGSRPPPVGAHAEVELGLVRVVRAAAQLEILDGRGATARERRYMVELQEASRLAAAISPHKGASALIAAPDCAPDRRRHVA